MPTDRQDDHDATPEAPGTVRLAKFLAQVGLASRREAERIVAEGTITVNGQVVHHPGHPVDPLKDEVRHHGQTLKSHAHHIYLLLHKPKGVITTRSDPQNRPTVYDLVEGVGRKVEAVGRLDVDTEGALILTDDGTLAHKLTHPSTEVPKRYLAKIYRTPDERTIARIERGIQLEDGRAAPCKMRVVEATAAGNAWVEITVTEGRNRLVRRIFESVGHPVSKLKRVSFATVSVRDLPIGSWRPLTSREVTRLRDLAAGKEPSSAGKGPKYKPGFARAKPRRRVRKSRAMGPRGR